MGDCSEVKPRFWDIYPTTVKLCVNSSDAEVPLTVRGEPRGEVEFESADDGIATVDANGVLTLGGSPGPTMIMAYDSAARDSIRYVQVVVIDPATGGSGE